MHAGLSVFKTFSNMPTHRINKLIYTIDQGEEIHKISNTLAERKISTKKGKVKFVLKQLLVVAIFSIQRQRTTEKVHV